MSLIDPDILAFYSSSNEEHRLTTGLGPLEFERNKTLILRFLPERKSFITDVGGGTGHYSVWLASLGHKVHLFDPVPKHISLARKKAALGKYFFESTLADGRSLPLAGTVADLVILHGPLYHLQEREERLKVLQETLRILKPDGVVLAFAISRTASLLAALIQGIIHEPSVLNMVRQELKSGEHFAPENFPGMLPDAYFHKPSELKEEVEEAGFTILDISAVEGPVWLDKNFFSSWSQPDKKKNLLELITIAENDPDTLCLSPHYMVAAVPAL